MVTVLSCYWPRLNLYFSDLQWKALYAIINPMGNVAPVLELLDKWDLVSREMLLGSTFLFLDINLSHLPLFLFSLWQSQIDIKQEKKKRQKGRCSTAIWFYVVIIKELNWPFKQREKHTQSSDVVKLPGVFNFHGNKCPLKISLEVCVSMIWDSQAFCWESSFIVL